MSASAFPGDSKVVVLILNWNSAESTCRCIESLLESDYPNVRVVIVDNASSDGSARKLLDWAKTMNLSVQILDQDLSDSDPTAVESNLTLIMSDVNRGYAGGNNLGLRYALHWGAEYLLVLNDDTILPPKTLFHLVQTLAKDESVGIAGCKTVHLDNGRTVSYQGGDLNYWIGGLGRMRTNRRLEKFGCRDVNMVSGACMFIRVRVIEEIGMLREDFFLYAEDMEYSLRALKAGWRLRVNLDAEVQHRRMPGRGKRAPYYYYYTTRNMLYLSRIHLRGLQRFSFLAAFLLIHLAFAAFWLSRGMVNHLRAASWGYFDYLRGVRGQANHRFLVEDERERSPSTSFPSSLGEGKGRGSS